MSLPNRVKVKIIVVGEKNTGKTSLIKKYVPEDSHFNQSLGESDRNSGYEFKGYHKDLSIVDGVIFDMDIWDTYKGESYSSLTGLFTRESKGCFIVCDVTDESTIEAANNWVDAINDKLKSEAMNVPFFLIGNKIDLLNKEQIQEVKLQLQEKAKELQCTRYYMISCKEDINATKPYDDLIEILKEYKPKKFIFDKNPSMILSSENLMKDNIFEVQSKKKCSC